MTTPQKVDLARRIVKQERGLKKQPHGRIIRVIPLGNGRQRVLHATRGWREARA